MNATWFCEYCGFKEDIWNKYFWQCPRCKRPLSILFEKNFKPAGKGVARYSSILPFKPEKSLGEGSTPLVVREEGKHRVLFKLEYLNPSGSFKDRGSAISIYYAYRMGFREVVEDTSGNTGISVAMYARLYGLKPYIVMPASAPEGKKALVESLGGVVVEALNRGEAAKRVLEYIDSRYYVAHTWSFFYVLGSSTIAYEVFEEYNVPDYIIAPIGSGGLLLGLLKGFEYLSELGIADHVPIPIGVQGYSVQPVYRTLYSREEPGEDSSLADGIMVPNPPRLAEIAESIKRAGGRVVLVNNAEIARALRELYSMGFIVEPTSASAYAAYLKVRDGLDQGTVLIPLTGSGLKTLGEIAVILKQKLV